MKKMFLLGLCLLAFATVSSANTLEKLTETNLSNDGVIYNLTLTNASQVYTVTLEAGISISIDIQAVGNTVNWCMTDSLTDPYWSIPANFTKSDQLRIPYDVGKKLYFWSSNAGSKIQIHQIYQ